VNAAAEIPVVQLRAVSKTYVTGEVEVKAVCAIDAEIAHGEFVAIVGASGSGKSTLMNILGCLDKPSSGEYRLDGVRVSALDRRQLAVVRNEKIGFVFQGFNLLSRMTALENVELPMLYSAQPSGARTRHRRAGEALRRVGLGSRLGHTPSQLSGGQQQRVAIARALVNNPEVLLADEATGNLDSHTSVEIMGLFRELNRCGITVIMITHEPDIARYSGRILTMLDGRILSDLINAAPELTATQRSSGTG
jgi:putative ABC transport system ATP-binding protein